MINFKLKGLFRFFWLLKGMIMEKLLRCTGLGVDCDFEACGGNAEEALKTAVDHARAIHGLKDISGKDRLRALAAIQDAFCVPKGGYNPGGGALY
jgi:predicted small metal-binding protein